MMGLFDLFKTPEPIDDPDLGSLSYEHRYWAGRATFPFGEVEMSIDGDKKGLDPFARRYWLQTRARFPQLWDSAISFSLEKLAEWGWGRGFDRAHFAPWSVSVHRERSFDGGHLVFWFSISIDEDGAYYVSFRDEKPYYFHRDG